MRRLPPHLYFGLDLGQRRDPAALAILQRIHEPTGEWNRVTWEPEWELLFRLRHVERFPLGTPYITIVSKVRHLIRDCTGTILGGWPVAVGHPVNPRKTLVVDASGVGAPIVELFHRCDLDATLIPVTIIGNGSAHSDAGSGYVVPRRDLVSNLRILLERGLLKIPTRLHDHDALRKEVLELQDRSGTRRDDMAIALALASWWAARNVQL
ncbi:hypothetical protein [uncultured Paludibaculum sp.]|uniref:hypothetical protein n=1 Tax=uncultured Paludibaculum sp. TaxID=1765020 RepID=UPI002AAB5930|nr:hypothetical protein [uncultured Paludibaculum sp.]